MKITIELDTSILEDAQVYAKLTNPVVVVSPQPSPTAYTPNLPPLSAGLAVAGGPPAEPVKRRRKAVEEVRADLLVVQTPAPEPVKEPTPPEPVVAKTSFLDEDEKPTTKDDVRAALIALQTQRHAKFIGAGVPEAKAAQDAEAAAVAILTAAGAARLGLLPETAYADVVKAANAALAQ